MVPASGVVLASTVCHLHQRWQEELDPAVEAEAVSTVPEWISDQSVDEPEGVKSLAASMGSDLVALSYNNDVQVQAQVVQQMNCHCLAITGQKDVQVRNEFCVPDTAKALIPNAASMESHRPPNLTHALRSLKGPARLLNVKEDYTRLGKLPLDPELLSLIDNWCDRVLAV